MIRSPQIEPKIFRHGKVMGGIGFGLPVLFRPLQRRMVQIWCGKHSANFQFPFHKSNQ
jgi:hypothetical protein